MTTEMLDYLRSYSIVHLFLPRQILVGTGCEHTTATLESGGRVAHVVAISWFVFSPGAIAVAAIATYTAADADADAVTVNQSTTCIPIIMQIVMRNRATHSIAVSFMNARPPSAAVVA